MRRVKFIQAKFLLSHSRKNLNRVVYSAYHLPRSRFYFLGSKLSCLDFEMLLPFPCVICCGESKSLQAVRRCHHPASHHLVELAKGISLNSGAMFEVLPVKKM